MAKWLNRMPGSLTPESGRLKSIFTAAPVESFIRGTSADCGSGASWAKDVVAAIVKNARIRVAKRIEKTPRYLNRMFRFPRLVKYQKIAGKVS